MSKGSDLASAAVLVFAVTTAGRLLGFVRDLVIARYFGATAQTDAFLVAWLIPETISPLLQEGALYIALLPLFARELEQKGTIKNLIPRTLSPIVVALLILTAAVALSAPWTVPLLAPGLSTRMELLAVRMVGVASITICFIGLAGYARAALNAYQIFGIPASVYAAYNIGILGSILLLHERLGIYSAALGLALGSALMFLVQVPTFLRTVGLPRLSFKIDRTILNEFVAFVPLGVFVIARHGQVYVERFLGSFLEPGVISQLNFATRLAQFPMSVAITVGIVSFPVLARAMAAGRTEEAEKSVESDIKMVSTLILPATAYLIIFAPEVVAVLFERGAFTPDDTVATASILRIYSLGLLAQTLIMVGIRPFYTHRYSIWMPMRAALGGLAVTVAVDVALLRGLGADGLAAGNAAGISVMALILGWDMNRHVVNVNTRRLARFFLRIFGVVILASFCALPLVLPQILPGLPKLGTLLFGAVILGIVYLIVGRSLDIEEIKKLQNYAMRVTGGRDRG